MSGAESHVFSDADFSAFKRKVKMAHGLDLDAYKRPQMERRLKANMERCGARSFQHYFALMETNQELLEHFLDRVTINVSELFRNPEQFEVLRTRVLPELLDSRSDLNVWSAGCSYGAEPYSLAVLLAELPDGSGHSILATDIDEKMLARAREGLFTEQDARNVSTARLSRHFERTTDGRYKAAEHLKKMISFRSHNLLMERFRPGFDLILCRNVVIYFTDEAKSALYRRFFESLRPGGYLFVGSTERIAYYNEIGFENTIPLFYRRPNRK